MKIVKLIVLVVIGFLVGFISNRKPEIGVGVYFENDRLVIDGGRHQGYVFDGNAVDITLPKWMEEKVCPDGVWRNFNVRNFHFDYRGVKPNVIELPSDPNSVIVVEGNLLTKTFIEKERYE